MASTPDPPSPDEEDRTAQADEARRDADDDRREAAPGASEYDVGEVLRAGWGGTLREGRHRVTGRRVTLEEVRPDLLMGDAAVDRLAAEGRAASALRDPHLVTVYDLVRDGARLVLVAEWTGDPTLAERLRTGWPAAREAVQITAGVLAGLEALHAAGLYHGAVGAETVLAGNPARLAELAVCAAGAPPGTGPETDVQDAARLGTRLIRRAGAPEASLRRPLEAALVAPTGAAALRADLEAAAADALGPGWRDPVGPAVSARRPRLRRRHLVAAGLVIAAVAGGIVAGALLAGHDVSPPLATRLTIAPGAHVSVQPAAGGCDTTFDFVAAGNVTGTGVLVYRWEQSDGEATDDTSLPIRPEDSAFQVTEAWRLQGSQAVDGTMTLHILRPVDRRLTASFRYACP